MLKFLISSTIQEFWTLPASLGITKVASGSWLWSQWVYLLPELHASGKLQTHAKRNSACSEILPVWWTFSFSHTFIFCAQKLPFSDRKQKSILSLHSTHCPGFLDISLFFKHLTEFTGMWFQIIIYYLFPETCVSRQAPSEILLRTQSEWRSKICSSRHLPKVYNWSHKEKKTPAI